MAVQAIIFDASDVLYDHRGPYLPMLLLVRELGKKYKLGMITNLPTDSVERIFSTEERKLFSYIHTYGKAGLSKPDPAVFKHTAEELDVASENCIYIDDMYSNVHAAEEAGMQTITYKDFEIFSHQLEQMLKEEA